MFHDIDICPVNASTTTNYSTKTASRDSLAPSRSSRRGRGEGAGENAARTTCLGRARGAGRCWWMRRGGTRHSTRLSRTLPRPLRPGTTKNRSAAHPHVHTADAAPPSCHLGARRPKRHPTPHCRRRANWKRAYYTQHHFKELEESSPLFLLSEKADGLHLGETWMT